ncbi:hypothetical protein GTW43_33805 [Streptomyces sp. SID5785]|uniref:hypothetical protein n=1 Tax=Streptomyces sp. SID5785 TaxID=2690309 RepID=UPI001361858E|nr:hypothetical protein [Streptomyces sp. SID5785]MZD10020.1 hypothetical protein [Streptomyces sp. SID5785]
MVEPGAKVEVTNEGLDKWAKDRLTARCSALQERGPLVFNAHARWWTENPHNNPDSARAWEAIDSAGVKITQKDWAEAGESWQWGARVAVRCDPSAPPPGAVEDYARYKYLEVSVRGRAENRDAYASMTLSLARGMVDKAECTNKVDLPAA